MAATPDFCSTGDGNITSVGEIQSSPVVQMLVAGLGHLSRPRMKYLLGIVVSKDRAVSREKVDASVTRWNSTFYMMERIVEEYKDVKLTLCSFDSRGENHARNTATVEAI